MPRKTTKRKTKEKKDEDVLYDVEDREELKSQIMKDFNISREQLDQIEREMMEEDEKLDSDTMYRFGHATDKEKVMKMWRELFTDTEAEVEHFFTHRFKHENLRVIADVYNPARIFSACHVIPHKMRIFGEPAEGDFLVGVGTPLEHQCRGYMDKLMRNVLAESYQKGKEIMFLQPIDDLIYIQYGFQFMTRLHYYDFKADILPVYDRVNLSVERVINPDDIIEDKDYTDIQKRHIKEQFTELSALYNMGMRRMGIYLERDEEYYAKYLAEMESENGRIYIVRSVDDMLGYISFYLKDDTILIREIITPFDAHDIQVILSILHGIGRYYPNIRFISPASDIVDTFVEQLKVSTTVKPMMMMRILDIPKFLGRSEIFFQDFKFKLEDDIIPENNGIYEFDHRGKLKYSKKGKADVTLSVYELNKYIAPIMKTFSYIQEYE